MKEVNFQKYEGRKKSTVLKYEERKKSTVQKYEEKSQLFKNMKKEVNCSRIRRKTSKEYEERKKSTVKNMINEGYDMLKI